jgi:hypothetical protein
VIGDLIPHSDRLMTCLEHAAELARAGELPGPDEAAMWAEAAQAARAALGAPIVAEGQALPMPAGLGELPTAALALLLRIDGMTTEEFSRGGERVERERLRAALVGNAGSRAGDRAQEAAPAMLAALQAIYQRHSHCFPPLTRDITTADEAAALKEATGRDPGQPAPDGGA